MEIEQHYLGPEGEAEDRYWMRRALAMARRGVGATSPNPPVGAVLVKERRLLTQGFHRRAGGPHAEIEAFAALEDPRQAEGATLYVTLEPCSTQGRTPPCTEAILHHRVQRVVFGSVDPNPAHAGEAVAALQARGIAVAQGVRRDETDALIRIFRHWILTQRPYVIAKAGISLDGCLTRPPGESQWLTSSASRRDAQRLRVLTDGMLVGAETIRRDNPRLTVRHPWVPAGKRPLFRYVLTRSGELPQEAHVFTDAFAHRTRVVQDARWPQWLEIPAREGVTSLLLEGGGRTLTEALLRRAVNELHLYVAPRIAGTGQRLVQEVLGDKGALAEVTYDRIGDDVKITALIKTESHGR